MLFLRVWFFFCLTFLKNWLNFFKFWNITLFIAKKKKFNGQNSFLNPHNKLMYNVQLVGPQALSFFQSLLKSYQDYFVGDFCQPVSLWVFHWWESCIIPSSLQNSSKFQSMNWVPLSLTSWRGILYLHTILFHTNFLTFSIVILSEGSASNHLVK